MIVSRTVLLLSLIHISSFQSMPALPVKRGALRPACLKPVSYTHLDVYKRQLSDNKGIFNFTDMLQKPKTTFIFNEENGNRLLLIYPKNLISQTFNLNVNELMGSNSYLFLLLLLGIFIVYLGLLFIIIKRLSKSLNKELEELKAQEEELSLIHI